jgi:tripartite-type tricarboxylate transporter receptor subunit TctC
MFQEHLRKTCAAVSLVVLSSQALAQDDRQTSPAYPTRTISIISPSPGGGADATARIVGAALAQTMNATVIVDPRPGAGGNVANEYVARAPADGYTLLLALSSMLTVNPALYPNVHFNPLTDFRPIAMLGTTPYMLAASASVRANTVVELIALAKTQPGNLIYCSSGYGSPSHLMGVLFNQAAGVELRHVPYRTTSGATTDLLSGEVQAMFGSLYSLLPFVQAKTIKALGVTGSSRSAFAPDIPSIAETVPTFEFLPWYGLLAPAKTSDSVVEKLARATATVLSSPEVRRQLAEQGVDVDFQSGEQLATRTRAELEQWKAVIKTSGARVE